MKHKRQLIISIDAEKASDKIQHSFMKKILNKVDKEGTHLNIIKDIYEKSTAYIQWWKAESFSLRSGIRQRYSLLPFYLT